MATPISHTVHVRSILQPQLNPPKIISIRRSSYGGYDCVKCRMGRINGCSWSSVTTNLRLECGGGSRICRKSVVIRRRFIVKAATVDDIEAEKTSIKNDVKSRMEKTVESVRSNFNSIRTGRANPAMLDKIEVEYYGTPVNLKSIAQISTPDASSLMIQPFDKSSLKTIEKAIVASNLGMTPNNDGEVIRMTVPQLTSERRKELAKTVAKQAEEGKVALRNIRRDALKAYEKLEKEKKLSEDIVKDLSSELQKLTDEYVKKIDAVYKQKEKEVLQV